MKKIVFGLSLCIGILGLAGCSEANTETISKQSSNVEAASNNEPSTSALAEEAQKKEQQDKNTALMRNVKETGKLTIEEYKTLFPGPGRIDDAYPQLKIEKDISKTSIQELLNKYSWSLEGGGVWIFKESGEIESIGLDGRIEYFGKYSIGQGTDFYLEPDPASVQYANVITDHVYTIESNKLVLQNEEIKEHKITLYPIVKIVM